MADEKKKTGVVAAIKDANAEALSKYVDKLEFNKKGNYWEISVVKTQSKV